MAYRRSLSVRATLVARRLNPAFGYTSQHNDCDKHEEKQLPHSLSKFDNHFLQRRSFGNYMNNSNISPWKSTHGLYNPRIGFSLLHGMGSGIFPSRYMSTTSIGDGSDKAEYVTDIASVLTDAPMETIAAQAPVVSEVAIAAADSALPVAALQYVIDGVHSFTGLPWWASIALTTVLIRTATVPFLINQLKASTKLSMMRPRLEAIKEEMQEAAMDPQAIAEGQKRMQAVFKEYGVTPFTPLKGLLIQGPIFISFFFAIQNMVEKVPSFKTGGMSWFTDLTTPDSLYILPVLTSLSFLAMTELNMQEGLEGNPIAGTMKKFSRVVAFLTVPFTLSFPKAIFCYWVTSNLFSLAYGSVLKAPGVKKSLGISEIHLASPSSTSDSQSSHPGFSSFRSLKENISSSPTVPTPPPQVEQQSEPLEQKRSSSSLAISHRLAILERKVKQRKRSAKK